MSSIQSLGKPSFPLKRRIIAPLVTEAGALTTGRRRVERSTIYR